MKWNKVVAENGERTESERLLENPGTADVFAICSRIRNEPSAHMRASTVGSW